MTISIKFDDEDGRITNRFIGTKDADGWVSTTESGWPEPNPADDEIPEFYYDESTGDISVQYKTVTPPDEL